MTINSRFRVFCGFFAAFLSISGAQSAGAASVYWNLFNSEGENNYSAEYITYSTREDMLNDTNRTGRYSPDSHERGYGHNVVGSGSDGETYWSLFNSERENRYSAEYITYSSLADMLNDTNRTGRYSPDSHERGYGHNVVGSGSDGETYWSLFNSEGENRYSAEYITYSSLTDMLNDTNRTGRYSPDSFDRGHGHNVVGSGSDGELYWSLFNVEGENVIPADYIYYTSLLDMLNDTNRVGWHRPNGFGRGYAHNVVGSGAYVVSTVPLPAAFPLFATILSGFGILLFRRRKAA
ncbi:MAG: hypothetical protein MI743_10090 [Sneathiellales bacterium]|nr:hypothetical protein [Sneathiellales bacterium]